MRQIAFFDFDGTITTKDTMLEFIKYRKGNLGFLAGFALNSPFLVAYKAGIISNQLAKERILTFFFGKTSSNNFQEHCNQFADEIIPGLIRPKALIEIKKLQDSGVEVVIVSASAEQWISKWCASMGVEMIATRLISRSEKITGRIDGRNCHGEEKVNRIRAAYNLSDYDAIYAYGDTKGDKPMLGLATFAFYKPFR
ncbi:MAG: HAD-IB family hydrolase [Chitinophagaceae bacterium]|nr:HAD-IB family hydrolase [Chitinophagaceae bacterium]